MGLGGGRACFVAVVVLSAIAIVAYHARQPCGTVHYISNWYIVGAYVFTTIFWPSLCDSELHQQRPLDIVAVQGFDTHNAVGTWFTFRALGAIHPRAPQAVESPRSIPMRWAYWDLVDQSRSSTRSSVPITLSSRRYRGGFKHWRSPLALECWCRCSRGRETLLLNDPGEMGARASIDGITVHRCRHRGYYFQGLLRGNDRGAA